MEPGQARILAFPPGLRAVGADGAPYRVLVPLADLPPGSMRRVTFGDLDVLVAHTSEGIAAIDDRCPHMAAPLSIGELDGCVVGCPLHEGRFNLATGNPVQWPTTGGLDAEGAYHPVWTPGGREAKQDVPGRKTDARRITRIRRLRYYPVRLRAGVVEAAIPGA